MMGARGPLKIPAHLQVVRPGAPGGPSPVSKSAADKVHLSPPAKPDELPDAVSDAWDAIVPTLNDAGMLSPIDGATLELALRHFVQARMASDELLAADSVVIRDEKNGRDAKHPASQIMRDHSAEFLKYAIQLGLSFASRARISLPDDTPKDMGNPFA